MSSSRLNRRTFLHAGAAGLSGLALAQAAQPAPVPAAVQNPQPPRGKPTTFQIACMTLTYSRFPLERALTGIRGAGYRFVAWGTSHVEAGGKTVPVIAADAPPARAKELAARCRDLGLEPLMMFSGIYPEARNAVEVLTRRIEQAAAGKVPQVLTFGHTKGGNRKLWVERFRKLGPIAPTTVCCSWSSSTAARPAPARPARRSRARSTTLASASTTTPATSWITCASAPRRSSRI